MIGEGSRIPHSFWNPTLVRRIIRRCTNYIKRVSLILKREIVRRSVVPYKRSVYVALLCVRIRAKLCLARGIKTSFS